MNPLLQKTTQAVLQKADPRIRPVIEKLFQAGKKVMYAPQTRQFMVKQLGDGKDPEAVGAGVAKIIAIIFNQSNKTAPMQALIPAAVLLLMEGLQFLEDAGAIKVNPQSLAQYTQAMGSSVLQMFGVTPDKLQGMVNTSKTATTPAPTAAAVPPAGGILNQAQGAM
jgi:hypothetical protein